MMLRTQKFTGSIAIIGDEPELPYERPPLSKEYFAGEKEFERIQLRPAKYWDEREVSIPSATRSLPMAARRSAMASSSGRPVVLRACCQSPAAICPACRACARVPMPMR